VLLAVGLVQMLATSPRKGRLRTTLVCLSKSALGLALPYALVIAWDSARWGIRPGYWEQSALSYGGIAFAPVAEWGQRLGEWWQWARYLLPSLALIALLVGGGAALLIGGWRRRLSVGASPGKDEGGEPYAVWRQAALDTTWVAFGCGYMTLHVVLRFSVWDRYLLPLAAPIALVLARVVTHLWELIPSSPIPFSLAGRRGKADLTLMARAALVTFVCAAAAIPAWRAAHNGYPIGGEHWAYQGLDQIAAYLKEHAPPNAVLYHHWLRWHYSYYLYGTSFELRWWQSAEHLRQEAMRTPDRAQYIVLPDWATLEPYAEGLTFHLLYEAHRQDGTVSMRLYRIKVHLESGLLRGAKPPAAIPEM
jgi:hypothetical protein